MCHGSHGCACFLPFADYRKREDTKQPGQDRLFVQVGRRAVLRMLRAIWAVPRQTTTWSSGGLDSHPSHRYLTTLLADRPGLSALTVDHVDPFVFCVPDDRDPLHHKVLTVQALLGAFGDSRWHGESARLH
jgi:hypothetical protein